MIEIAKRRFWVFALVVGVLVASSANAGLFGLFKSKKHGGIVAPASLIVFPFDQGNVNNVPEEFGVDIASSLRTMLAGNRQYAAFLYRGEMLSPIKRAKDDSTLKSQEITPPFSEDRSKPMKLAEILAGDYFLVGAIDECKVDANKKFAEMTVSADLVKMVDRKTCKLVKTLTITGRSPDSTKSVDADELRALAAGDAVAKLMEQLLDEKALEPAKSEGEAAPAKEESAPVGQPAE